MKRCFLLLLAISLVTCTGTRQSMKASKPTLAQKAMVVSAHPLASRAGLEILQKGGRAVDASITTQLVLAVVHPSAGNLGGGGFMVYRDSTGKTVTLDYREKAAAASEEDMFLDKDQNVIPGLSESTHLASGIPGTIAGLWEAHQKYGTKEWKELVQPAIDLARKGIVLTAKEANGLNEIQSALKMNNSVEPSHMIKDTWKEGDLFVQADLASTLERIRDFGWKGFYEGKTADMLVAEMQRGGGIISHDDLRQYHPIWREPIVGYYKDYKIISMPPPSSGGVALIQLLKSIEPYPVSDWGLNSVKSTHLFTEAERRVYADRSVYLGDPDFYQVPVTSLTDSIYIHNRMKDFNPEKATPSHSVREGIITAKESEQTTHLSIVDQFGNAVAVTTTLNDSYGSKIVVAGAGFLLNNEMDDFSVKPGYPNMYGAIGGEANKIQPQKRMLSSMTPTIVEKKGKLFMVVGTPGGTTIITSVFQTIVNVIEYGMNMQEAVTVGRVHSQWLPDSIQPEEGALRVSDIEKLKAMGHEVSNRESFGRVDAILIREDGQLEGGADPRGDDTATGF